MHSAMQLFGAYISLLPVRIKVRWDAMQGMQWCCYLYMRVLPKGVQSYSLTPTHPPPSDFDPPHLHPITTTTTRLVHSKLNSQKSSGVPPSTLLWAALAVAASAAVVAAVAEVVAAAAALLVKVEAVEVRPRRALLTLGWIRWRRSGRCPNRRIRTERIAPVMAWTRARNILTTLQVSGNEQQ